jgi:stearoyl-CoA desaturase (delta-9 desaturase)
MISLLLFFTFSSIAAFFGINHFIGFDGLIGDVFNDYSVLKLVIYMVIMAHITITCMSLSFHRYHTHKGMIINPIIDGMMQIWLWLITSMSKPDWVSVHTYHHAHSDTEKDPHSPVQKGFWRIFLMGVADYSRAKDLPDVLKIRKTIKLNKLEKFISTHLFLGPYLFSLVLLVTFGIKFGAIMMLINFLISPLFAVGGVNALAHTYGYRNHVSGDNSRNIGFLFPLNWIICGELDHNNHHAHQKSCSFRHKWYEF